MKISLKDRSPEKLKTDLLAVPVQEQGMKESLLLRLDHYLNKGLSERITRCKFTGAEGSVLLHPSEGKLPANYVLLLGMGKERDLGNHAWRKAAARAAKEGSTLWAQEVDFLLPSFGDAERMVGPLAQGALMSSYHFDKYRTDDRRPLPLRSFNLVKPALRSSSQMERQLRLAHQLMRAVFIARDLVNEPPSRTTAVYLADQAVKHCRGPGTKVDVWGKKKIHAMGLAGLAAVNRGSHEEPRFIIIRYQPRGKARKKVSLIGKGITFDSGGLSLKSSKAMETMKLDMAGAAAVIGTMSALRDLSPQVQVTGYIPTTDNLPSATAQKPGDVIRYLNGKTVEVLNTDAEGRLILADALALAAKEKPDCMVNLATLTGACIVALGNEVAGIFGNDQLLVDKLIHAGRDAGEKLWQLPLVKEYREEIKSSVADIKNVGGSSAGAITAALFLQEFVARRPWAHLDIAGPAFTDKETPLTSKGGTGFGVLTLLHFLSTL